MTEFRYFLDLQGIKNFAICEKSRKSRNLTLAKSLCIPQRGGGGRHKSWGGVLKVFQGKSGDGKNFWRQGGGMLIDF